MQGQQYTRAKRPKIDRSGDDQICTVCACAFRCHRKKRYCSKACLFQAKYAARAKTPAIGRKKPGAIEGCPSCGTEYKVLAANQTACSRKCRDALYRQSEAGKRVEANRNALKRAVLRGTPEAKAVDIFRVFHRDGWICQLCRKKTIPEKRGTQHPKAPVIDHIMPISKGGTHTYDNVQCACHGCNTSKGAKAIGQMIMFGDAA